MNISNNLTSNMPSKFSVLHFLSHIVFIACFSCASVAAQDQEESQQNNDVTKMDRIVAIVDQTVVTENELNDRVRTVSAQMEKQGTQLPPEDILKKQILERLINDRLQLQFAAQTGLKVDDGQLDKTIGRIAEQNKLALPDFKAALEAEGIAYRKFREDIRTEIILSRLREREVENRISVTEAEIDNFLTTQSSRGEQQDEFDISHILVRTSEESSPEDLQKLRGKAEAALKKLQDGADFGQIAASFSDAPDALEGGHLGWKKSAEIPVLFLEALKPMQVGQLTPILRSPNGFHILKLVNRRGGSSALVIDQTHARHILVKLSEVVSEADAKHRLDTIKESLDNGKDFAEMARQYSEDASATNGGDLGWLNPGDTVPQFEKAMNALKINEISEPVLSPFGWHIIQVLERRKQDMTKEAARLKARQDIRTRKADEAYQDWVRELRDRAYVEIHLEDKF
jgi:peptidyl-prolyl cis-trans isomerase SurA